MADYGASTPSRDLRHRTGTRPSVRTILLVRFDDYTPDDVSTLAVFDEGKSHAAQPRARIDLAKIFGAPSGALALGSTDGREIVRRAAQNLGAAIATFRSADGLSQILDTSPVSSTRTMEAPSKASQLELELGWRELPLDSRVIRSILALHYEGTSTPEAWATGRRELAPNDPTPSGYIVPAIPSNLRFVGHADEIGDAHSGDGDTLAIAFRSLDALLLDTSLPYGEGVAMASGSTIVEIVKNILETNPMFQIFEGPYAELAEGSVLPRLSPALYNRLSTTTRAKHERSALIAKGRRTEADDLPLVWRGTKGGKESYWDAINGLCHAHGLRVRIDLNRIIIYEPRSLYRDIPTLTTAPTVPRYPAPDSLRAHGADARANVRRMVWGQNVESLEFKRKLAGILAPVVRVKAHNPDARDRSKRFVTVEHPPNTAVTKISAAGTAGTRNVLEIDVHGVTDVGLLRKIAEQTYESIGRSEVGVSLSTSEIASYSDDPLFDPNSEPDLLDCRHGDPIQILVTPTERDRRVLYSLAELNVILAGELPNATRGSADAVSRLEREGFSSDVARQLVQILRTANLPSVFRVARYTVAFTDSGFALTFDLRDYVRVRADPDDISKISGVDPRRFAPRNVAGGVSRGRG